MPGRSPLSRVDGIDPEHEALLADSVGLALLVVLERLSPPERLAFVLHDTPTFRPMPGRRAREARRRVGETDVAHDVFVTGRSAR